MLTAAPTQIASTVAPCHKPTASRCRTFWQANHQYAAASHTACITESIAAQPGIKCNQLCLLSFHLQADAFAQLQQVQITGALPNITTYCIYGNGVATPRTLKFNATFKAGDIAELPTASTSTTGDKVVAFASLRLCDK
jgi:hypothetical protein